MTEKISRRNFIRTGSLVTAGLLLGCRIKNRFQVIIKNGQILDGLGKAPVKTDIGISGTQIEALADFGEASADRIIDAQDRFVAPGFIDIHTHTDTELLVNPKAESKIRQGVTTEVAGNCGSSPFPLNDKMLQNMNKRLKEKYGFEGDWQDIAGFYRALERKKIAFNYMSFTGHGDLRTYVVGKNDVAPSKTQMTEMKRLLQRSMEQGSLGLSTGLEYAPGSYAETGEIIELCQVVAQNGGVYATHMRDEDDKVEAAIAEALEISRQSGVSLQISHLKACNQPNWHKVDHMLEMIHEAADEGLPVKADRYPYDAWGTGLSSFLPLWARQGDTEEILARLKDKPSVPRIRKYMQQRAERIGGWDRVVISNCHNEANERWEGKSIQACAEATQKEPWRFVFDLLIEEKNRVGVIGFAMSEENLGTVLADPLVMIGSDGSAVAPYGQLGEGKPHPRYYGTFPRVLGKYARQLQIFDIPTAVQKMTSMPARKLKLQDRGVLQKGKKADITVFDPKTVIDQATFTTPHQYPKGIEYVLVNGEIVIKKGQHTGQLPGQVLRHPG